MILNNIESILEELKNRSEKITDLEKYDGITIECKIKKGTKFEEVKEEITETCKELEIMPVQLELNKDEKNKCIIQFPDLNIIYSNEEVSKFYNYNFEWLFKNASARNNLSKNPIKITKALLISGKDVYVKQAITIYYKSNVNRYKFKLEDFTNNVEYRQKVDEIFYKYVDTYCLENNIQN